MAAEQQQRGVLTSNGRQDAKHSPAFFSGRGLEHGRLHRFKDWPIDAVPKEPGIYTVWNQPGEFLYVGIALEGKNGLRGRLGSHANGRRGGDQFNVYVADRLVLQLLDAEQIAQITAGKLLFDRGDQRVHSRQPRFPV